MDAMDLLADYWSWIVLAVLVVDKLVAATPCKWDDLIVTAVKGALRQVMAGRGKTLPVLLLASALGLGAWGCAVQRVAELPPHDQARAVVDLLLDEYADIHAAYLAAEPGLSAGDRAWCREKLTPALNRAKPALVAAASAANAWSIAVTEAEAAEAQARYEALAAEARTLLAAAVDLWNRIATKEK